MELKNLETPALLVDMKKMKDNMRVMQNIMAHSSAQLRPHYKTHKIPAIAKMQIEWGAKGITAAKLSEAEDLAEAGIEDILIANQIVQPTKIKRLAQLALRSKITVCEDNVANVKSIAAAAKEAGSQVYCYVEYDVGMNRCGAYSFEEVYVLAREIEESKNLIFAGIQAYAGQIAHATKSEREAEVLQNEMRIKELLKYLEMRGIAVKEVSGGSTGTAEFKAAHGVYTEIQAGSYLFLDTSYGALATPFHNALYVATTVISKHAHGIITDAGLKSIATDQGPILCKDYKGRAVTLHEEHGAIAWENAPLQIGDMLLLIPGHCCTTVNLHDRLYVLEKEKITEILPVTSRGKSI